MSICRKSQPVSQSVSQSCSIYEAAGSQAGRRAPRRRTDSTSPLDPSTIRALPTLEPFPSPNASRARLDVPERRAGKQAKVRSCSILVRKDPTDDLRPELVGSLNNVPGRR